MVFQFKEINIQLSNCTLAYFEIRIYNIGIRYIAGRYIMKRCIGGGYNEYESEKIYSVN